MIDYPEFVRMFKRFPLVLFPAFRLQDVMQKKSLGERAWLKINEKYSLNQQREAYRKAHNGADQPLTFLQSLSRLVSMPWRSAEPTLGDHHVVQVGASLAHKSSAAPDTSSGGRHRKHNVSSAVTPI